MTDSYRPQSYYDSSKWRATWEGEGGGVLLNQALHQLDIMAMDDRIYAKINSFRM